jgi:DNA polymerase-1
MPKFIDTKILDYVESSTFRNQSFEEWAEFAHNYGVSSDPLEQAMERAYFSFNRAALPRKEETRAALEMDDALMEVLADMETTGVYVDAPTLRDVGQELQEKASLLLQEMHELVNEPFNPLSAKQVQYILFTKLGIPVGKKVKTGFSVDSETLEEISKTYAIAGMILEYRGYEKLRSTYAEGLLREINPETGRIHTTYKQTLTTTGRLACENPNLQNIPAGSGYAKTIKSAFRPKDSDWTFVVADYSQVELRVLAMLSGDTELIHAFRNEEDIHERTARFLFPNSKTIS